MNKQTTYVLVAVLVIIVVVGAAGAYILLNTGGNGGEPEPTPTPSVADATSLQFTVEATTDGETSTTTYYAKNIGGSEALLRVEVDLGEAGKLVYIINGAEHKAWMGMADEWSEADFEETWDDWNALWAGYVQSLAHWTEGEYTSEDGTVKISNISLNPTLADSLFQAPS